MSKNIADVGMATEPFNAVSCPARAAPLRVHRHRSRRALCFRNAPQLAVRVFRQYDLSTCCIGAERWVTGSRQADDSGGNESKMNHRPFWTFIPFLLLAPPLFVIGVYQIYKFAVGSLQGAMIVVASVTLWVVGSLIWVYVIYPRLQKKRTQNPN
jgi:hypothetical protein